MTLLAGLGIGTTGILVVFGAVTGRLAAMVAALVKPSDLATAGGYTNGVADTGMNAATGPDASTLLMGQLVKQVRYYGAQSDPAWKSTVEPLVVKATSTRKQSDYDAAITALRALIAKHKPTNTRTGG